MSVSFSRLFFSLSLPLLFLALTGASALSSARAAAAAADPCAAFSRCSECVFDASDGMLSAALDCAWCPERQRCLSINTSAPAPTRAGARVSAGASAGAGGSGASGASAGARASGAGAGATGAGAGATGASAAGASAGGKEGEGGDSPGSVPFCADMRHRRYNPTCPDMSCSAAKTTNNIYICRPSAILAFVFGIFLFLYSLFFYAWLFTVRQLPWKYEPWLSRLRAGCPEQDALELPRSDGVVIANVEETFETCEDEQMAPKKAHSKRDAQGSRTRTPSSCPICKMTQPRPLGPGHVCFWCNIARFGFIVFYIGISASVLSFVLLFSISLKPWFADSYFAGILVTAYAIHFAFALYVFYRRKNCVHTEEARQTLYIELMIFLHGRSLLDAIPALRKKVFAQKDGVSVLSSTPSGQKDSHLFPSSIEAAVCISSPTAEGLSGEKPKLSEPETFLKKGETTHLLGSSCLNKHFRNILCQTLRRDELILWWEKPDVSSIVSYNAWLIIDLSMGVVLGIWMIVSSTIKDTNYLLIRLIGTTTMGVIGTVFVLVFSFLLIMTLNSCTRLYFLTDQRLLTIYSGLVSPTVSDTPLQSVRSASVYGYKDWNSDPVLAFSWEDPTTNRKMRTFKGYHFPGVVNLHEFLHYFNMFASPLPHELNKSREDMRYCRQVWRMYLFFTVLSFEILSIVTLYPQMMPGFHSFILFLVLGVIHLATVHRGLRVQHFTYAPLSLAENWGNTQKKETETKGSRMCHAASQPHLQ